MPVIVNKSNSKVSNIKPLNRDLSNNISYSNVSFPFLKKFTNYIFGEKLSKLIGYTPNNGVKIPVPGEGLPRVIHYCADQSGCAFWRMLWPSEELLAHNKAVVMTLYQMVTIGQFYLGIDAVKLQRQCTPPQLEFIKFLRGVSDEIKKQNGKGFRIIYEIDDVCCPAKDIPDYNVCKTAFEGDEILNNMRNIIHLCIDKDARTPCIIDNVSMEVSMEELHEYYIQKKEIYILSKNLENNVIEFKPLENIWVTSENADVIEITDDINNVSLICTPEHPVFTKNRGWVEARNLLEEDLLDII